MKRRLVCLVMLLAAPLWAAERVLDFSEVREGQLPPGFRSALTGKGKPGEWKIVMDQAPSAMQSLTPQAPSVSRRPVLAQVSHDPTDERFPLLIFEGETYGDFTLTTHFKTVAGAMERMAGIAFRIQNETNYYVVRASSLGNTFRFYKVVNGERGNIIGPETPIPSGVWHEMTVECKGNRIRCLLNGKELIPPLMDSSFTSGKIGFWTKSDSVSYFTDTRIVYTPREAPVQAIVRDMIKNYPRLLGLQVFISNPGTNSTRLIASKDESECGRPGGSIEQEVIAKCTTYYGKEKDSVSVVLPMRDRNGDPIAAVRVRMKSFTGQTEANAITRATPIVKEMQKRVESLQDLTE